MAIDVKPLLQTAARSVFAVVVSVAGHTVFGLVLGILLLAALFPELRALGKLEGMPMTRVPVGAVLAIPVIVADNWKLLLVVAAFAVAFPVAWFVAGKRNGIRKIVNRFVGAHRAGAARLAADALFDGMERASAAAPGADAKVRALASRAAASVRGAPRVVRFAARIILGRLAELPALGKALEVARDPAIDRDQARRRTEEILAEALDPRDFAPSLRPALALAAAELAAFVAIKLVV